MISPNLPRKVRRSQKITGKSPHAQNVVNRLIWMMAVKAGGAIKVSVPELNSVPAIAGVKIDYDKVSDTVTIMALNMPVNEGVILPPNRLVI